MFFCKHWLQFIFMIIDFTARSLGQLTWFKYLNFVVITPNCNENATSQLQRFCYAWQFQVILQKYDVLEQNKIKLTHTLSLIIYIQIFIPLLVKLGSCYPITCHSTHATTVPSLSLFIINLTHDFSIFSFSELGLFHLQSIVLRINPTVLSDIGFGKVDNSRN